jgi:hypothetical protein
MAQTTRIVTALRVATCLTVIFAFVLSEFFSFSGPGVTFLRPTWWGICAVGAVVFLATSASPRARIVFGLAMLACTVVGAYKLYYFLPLQHGVERATFVNEPVPDILHAIAKQRQTGPYRRFVICDHRTLNKQLTLSIPDGCRLGEALEMITNATGTEYDWHWYSWCGNTYPPTTAKIYIHTAGGAMTRGLWETNGRRLWRRDDEGILLTAPEGEVVTAGDRASAPDAN